MTKRLISILLTCCMVLTMLPTSAMAYLAEKADSLRITTADGELIPGEDWETVFPHGTFAFETSESLTAEGDTAPRTIKLYRLGGTVGKAEVTISVTPAVTMRDDNTYSTAMAAGFYDYVLSVEDDLPIAAYQAYGRDAQPQVAETPAAVSATETEEGSTVLSLSVNASA